jgi:hypothetical protein
MVLHDKNDALNSCLITEDKFSKHFQHFQVLLNIFLTRTSFSVKPNNAKRVGCCFFSSKFHDYENNSYYQGINS